MTELIKVKDLSTHVLGGPIALDGCLVVTSGGCLLAEEYGQAEPASRGVPILVDGFVDLLRRWVSPYAGSPFLYNDKVVLKGILEPRGQGDMQWKVSAVDWVLVCREADAVAYCVFFSARRDSDDVLAVVNERFGAKFGYDEYSGRLVVDEVDAILDINSYRGAHLEGKCRVTQEGFQDLVRDNLPAGPEWPVYRLDVRIRGDAAEANNSDGVLDLTRVSQFTVDYGGAIYFFPRPQDLMGRWSDLSDLVQR